MLVQTLWRALFRSGLQRLGVQRRFVSVSPDPVHPADMNRSRGQIRRVLCVAEKNDAAKGIAEIMSNGRSRRVSAGPHTHTVQTGCRIGPCVLTWSDPTEVKQQHLASYSCM